MKKLDIKYIFSKFIGGTFTFILATIFSLVFKTVFGENNMYIGISSFVAMFMYLERDLTTNFFENTLKFVVMNLAMGIVVFIGSYNMWLAIPLNFILIFVIGYITCNELRRPVYVPFMLQFVLLIGFPVPHDKEGLRLLALIFGALIIMIPQLLINRNRVKKNSVKIFVNLNNLIKEKVRIIQEKGDTKIIDSQIDGVLRSLKYLIFDSREKKFYISKEGEASLSLLTALEKINISLSHKEIVDERITIFINEYFDMLNDLLEGKIKVKEFSAFTKIFIEQNKIELGSGRKLQIINSLILIDKVLKEATIKTSEIKKVKERIEVNKDLDRTTKNSLGFSYGIRVAIGMTITCFLTQYFNFTEGQWMMFTIFSLVNPVYETTKFKTKDRIIATVLGAIVVVILLGTFKGMAERTAILMIVGYIMCYTKKYRVNIFLATICIVTLATGSGNVYDYAMQRIVFVILGMVVAIILNSFILRCDIKSLNVRFKEKYETTIYKMMDTIYEMAEKGQVESLKIKNLFLTCAAIDKSIRDNFQVAGVDFKEEIKLNHHILVSDLYILYIELEKYIDDKKYRKFIMKSMNNIENINKKPQIISDFKDNIEKCETIEIKLAYINILEILEKFKILMDNKENENVEKIVMS